jgi:hypothetical protein
MYFYISFLLILLQNKIPKDISDWITGHPMAFEMEACLRPIILANAVISAEYLQEQMHNCGAVMLRVEENSNPRLWDLVFHLELRFYCNVTMDSNGLIPDVVQEIFLKERQKILDLSKNKEDLLNPTKRAQLIQQQEEMDMVRGILTEEEEDEEAEEERLEKDSRDARDAAFRLNNVRARIQSFRLYVQGS